MPFCYTDALLLIDRDGNTNFPAFKKFVSTSKSKNWRHKLSSLCRSLAHPLPPDVAAELISKFDLALDTHQSLAHTYFDAIPKWELWEARSKEAHPWKPEDRKKAYKENYGSLATKPRRCGKKHC